MLSGTIRYSIGREFELYICVGTATAYNDECDSLLFGTGMFILSCWIGSDLVHQLDV